MSGQRQTVVLTKLADRHAELHGRDYAHSVAVIVEAGDLASVLAQASRLVSQPIGRYSVSVSEPWDRVTPTEAGEEGL